MLDDYHCIRYTIHPHKLNDFEAYGRKWMEGDVIRRCGGKPIGYFLPKKGLDGSDNIALALIEFKSLADYENYRGKLMDDSDARANLAEGPGGGRISRRAEVNYVVRWRASAPTKSV